MLATITVLASEAHGIPPTSIWAKVSVPLGILIFIGLTYILIRSNLGTRRGYLVTGTSLFGFMTIYAMFWAFGAPGTPPNTGPQNLPGQPPDAYTPVFRPFAGDSLIADNPDYDVVKDYPEGFSPDEPDGLAEDPQTAIDEIKTFFSTKSDALAQPPLNATDEPLTKEVLYAQADNGRAIIAVPYVPTYQPATGADVAEGEELPLTPRGEALAKDSSNQAPAGTKVGDIVEGEDPQVFFAFFDPGGENFPSQVVLGITILLFGLHVLLLFLDERRERRETRSPDEVVVNERVRVEA